MYIVLQLIFTLILVHIVLTMPVTRRSQTRQRVKTRPNPILGTVLPQLRTRSAHDNIVKINKALKELTKDCGLTDEVDGVGPMYEPITPIQSEDDESDMDNDLPFVYKTVFHEKSEEDIFSIDNLDGMDNDEAMQTNSIVPSTSATHSKTESSLVLCDKSVVLFTGKHNDQVMTDVKNSLILAQLNADNALRRERERIGREMTTVEKAKLWSTKYSETFVHMNWVTANSQIDEVQIKGKDLSMKRVILEVIESIGDDQDKTILKKALSVLEVVPGDSEAIKLWNRRTNSRDLTTFSVDVVHIDDNGDAVMKTAIFTISTKQDIQNVLWFRWTDEETKIWKNKQTFMLGVKSFDSIRATVTGKIQKMNETYISDIDF